MQVSNSAIESLSSAVAQPSAAQTTSRFWSRWIAPGCILLFLALLWAYPLLSLRLPAQFDFSVHLRWTTQFYAALKEGSLLPRWAYASLDGLGDPTFFYYQPLAYYITSLFRALGCGPDRALVLAEVVPYGLVGAIVFRHFLQGQPGRGAVFGTLFVLASPPLYFLATQMGALPWVFSFPFSVLFVAESIRARQRPVHLSLLLCLTCLSHLLSGMMVLLAVPVARLIFLFPTRRNLPEHVRWGLGVALGMGLAAFFIYPAISQLQLITPSGWSASFDWRRGFVFPLFTYFRYGLLWMGPQIPFPLLALGLAGLTLFPRFETGNAVRQLTARRLAIVALVALAFGSELAYPLYAGLGALQKLQFPYRFMFLATLLGSIAFVIHLHDGAWARWNRAVKCLAVLLMGLYLAQTGILGWKLVKYGEPLPQAAKFMSGRFGQPEYLPAVHGPHWEDYIAKGKLTGECLRLGIRCNVVSAPGQALSVVVNADRDANVRLPVFAFPAWRVNVDGIGQAYAADTDTGLMLAKLPSGQHTVTLTWSRLPSEIAGLWISTGVLCILLGSVVFSWSAGWAARRVTTRRKFAVGLADFDPLMGSEDTPSMSL